MATNKRDLKAYSRFDGTGRIVPGSTVLRRNKPKNGNWKETQAYECCDGGGCPQTGPFTFTLFEVPEDFGTGSYIRLIFNCLTAYIIPTLGGTGTLGYATGQLSSPVTTSPTLSELVDLINVTFAGQGIVAELVEGVLQVTVSNTDYISEGCTGSYLALEIIIQDLP
jgi:hypothetical protein